MTLHQRSSLWPTQSWRRQSAPEPLFQQIKRVADDLFDLPEKAGKTLALFVTQSGCSIYERYAENVDATTPLPSWSMAKSIVHALAGIMVRRNELSVHEPAPVFEWLTGDDPRQAITIDDLMTMRSGLEFLEDYADDQASDVIQMLWGKGCDDVAAYAANKPLLHKPGTFWSYSSGTTNILCRILGDRLRSGRGCSGIGTENVGVMLNFMFRELFSPIGMQSPIPKFDRSGTFKGSSFCFCSAEDFARFGYLYLRDGIWEGNRVLPAGWVDYARRPIHVDEQSGYGAHWWITPDQQGFYASGYEGQHILIVPSKDLVIVKLGKSPIEHTPALFEKVVAIANLF